MPEPSLEPIDKGLEGSLSDSVGEEWTAAGGGEANRECWTLNPRADTNWKNEGHCCGEETRLFPQKTDERHGCYSAFVTHVEQGIVNIYQGGLSQGCLTEPLLLELRD